MNCNQAVLIFSGYNVRGVIAFCRWATLNDISFHIIAANKNDQIFLTDYKNQVVFIRESSKLQLGDFNKWVDKLCDIHGYHRVLILPTTEYLNRFLIHHRNEFEREKCCVPLVEKKLYISISDKSSFADICHSYGLDIPEATNHIHEQFPFVAKPRTYQNVNNKQLIPYLINDGHDLAGFLEQEDAEDFFYQEYVVGRSIYLLAYCRQDKRDILFSQENLMQQTGGKSIILAKPSNFHETSIAQAYVNMLHDIGFFGLIMIEVRFDQAQDRCTMIEANPRLWGPLQLAVDNNIDLFGAMLKDYGFLIQPSDSSGEGGKNYFWSGGISNKAQPIAYHNYSGEQFVVDFSTLRTQDLFFRTDTFNLFVEEAGMVDIYEQL